MKWQKTATELDIDSIIVNRGTRQRQPGEILDVSDIQSSIAQFGLFNPVIVDDNLVLQAGERRLTACKNLGHKRILCRKVSDLTQAEAQLIELHENIKRLDLTWQDSVLSVARIHRIYKDIDPDWTLESTAKEIGLAFGTVGMYKLVAEEMDEPQVSSAATVREAYNRLKRRSQREAGAALQELLDAPDVAPEQVRTDLTPAEVVQVAALKELGEPLPAHLKIVPTRQPAPVLVPNPESILHASFLDWAPAYAGEKFNLVHCDFPYGVNLFSGPQGRGAEFGQNGRIGYKDTPDIYWELVRSFCANLNKFMSVSAHLMFWLSADHKIVSETVRLFGELAPSLQFQKFPLIWGKSDNSGIASDVRMNPRHTYEACLMASRGNRQIVKVKGDYYQAPANRDLHPSTKPEPMLRHFMEMLVDEHTLLLDPTCGSGASLRAAESLGAKAVLGLEIDRQYIDPARLALKQARQKKAAESIRSVELVV